jgi:serine/threonine protein phosphatase PrpC
VQYFIYSEAGYNHQNEDSVIVSPHPQDDSLLICALADGQGGQMGGAAASKTAVDCCLKLALAQAPKRLFKSSTWYEIVSGADGSVCENSEAGYTTLIALCVNDAKICGVSCGDSAVLLVEENQSRLLTEQQRKNPPVGSNAAFPIAFSAKFRGDDKLLIMSDGVWKFLGIDTIAEIARAQEDQNLIQALRQLALEQNGDKLPDDFSIILVQ